MIKSDSEDSSSDLQESKPTFCKYCSETCDPYNNPNLKCQMCESSVHIRCLRRGGVPGGLIGDVFFDLTCQECHHQEEETLVRQKISWLGIVILTLYNLRAKSAGISNRGYFHWNLNVNAFVEKHWDILFPKNVKQKKNWKGTISGALSHSSKKGQIFFQSGLDELAEPGYWKLINNDPPEVLIAKNEQAINERKKIAKSSHQVPALEPQFQSQSQFQFHQDQSSVNSASTSPIEESSSDSYGDSSRTATPSMFSREYVQPSEILSDFLFADDEIPEENQQNEDKNQESDLRDLRENLLNVEEDLSEKKLVGTSQSNLDNQRFVVKNEQDLNNLLVGKDKDLNNLFVDKNQCFNQQDLNDRFGKNKDLDRFIVPDKDLDNQEDSDNQFGMKSVRDLNDLIGKNKDLDKFIVPDQDLSNQGDSNNQFIVPDKDFNYKLMKENRQELDLVEKNKDLSNRLSGRNQQDSTNRFIKYEPELHIDDEEDFDINMEQDLDMEHDQDINIDLKSFGDDDLMQFVNTFNPNWMHEMLTEDDDDEDDDDDDNDNDNDNDDDDDTNSNKSNSNSVSNSTSSIVSNKSNESEQEAPKSLFTCSVKREFPWNKPNPKIESKIRMNKNEEEYLLSTVNKAWLDKMTPRIRRLYRKLVVRRVKRLGNLRLTDWDDAVPGEEKLDKKERERIIDRFRTDFLTARSEQRLMGFCEHGEICSPYTQRRLKPFIRRDDNFQPLWLKVMAEIDEKVNGKKENWKPRTRGTVDFSYVRPQHIPGINTLACQFFWPGIDLTECLQYPDFTCVVLYKKLIIGFGILVPDVGFEESYISFFLIRPEWRNAGIGTFMLYHLIQTSMGKDVTLHVSATNPALILYQKFGFKIEQFVQDFYDKYMTTGAKESRHALFLRLSR